MWPPDPARALGLLLGGGLLLAGGAQALGGAPALLTLAGGCLLLGSAALTRPPVGAAPAARPRWASSPPAAPALIPIPLPRAVLTLDPLDGDSTLVARLQALDPGDFEHFAQLLLEAQGYRDVQVTGRGGDGGVDLVAWHGSAQVLVQCKRIQRPVGVAAIRDFYGALVHADALYGQIFATGGFTEAARAFAADKPLELLDGPHLAASVRTHLIEPHL